MKRSHNYNMSDFLVYDIKKNIGHFTKDRFIENFLSPEEHKKALDYMKEQEDLKILKS